MITNPAVTRDGVALRSERDTAAAAFGRLLAEAEPFGDPTSSISAAEVRAWALRVRGVAQTLADTVEAPMRNRVLELLESGSLPDDYNAVEAIRRNVFGMSNLQMGAEIGLSWRTIKRIEDGERVRERVMFTIASAASLNVSELFTHDRRCRTAGELYAQMTRGRA